MGERRLKVVFELIHESKQHLSDVRSSVGPATSESLNKVDTFITDLEKEIASDVPKESRIRNMIYLAVILGLLLAFGRLLQELQPEVVAVIGQILRK